MLLHIALGSALGGVGRYLVGGLVQRLAPGSFPTGTLVVNVTGSALLGFILRYALETPTVSPEMRGLLTIGLCGGYTTFSTFSWETLALLQDGDWRRALAYGGASLLGSLLATFAGFAAAGAVLADG